MKKLLLVLLLVCSGLVKGEVKLPSVVYSINDLVEEFRAPLRIKLEALPKNYITTYNQNQLVFTSHEAMPCLFQLLEAGQTLAKVEFFHKHKDGKLIEQAKYYGCNDQLSLIENIVTEGENLRPISFKRFIEGRRNFDLEKGQTKKSYRLLNDEGRELFRLDIALNGSSKYANWYIREQKFMNSTYLEKDKYIRATFTYYPYTVKYHRPWRQWTLKREFSPYSNIVNVDKGPLEKVVYINSQGKQISQNSFTFFFRYNAIERTVSKLKEMTHWHTEWFPSTEEQSGGGQGLRLLNELKLMFIRLSTNTDLNLVKQDIQKLIESVENNQIIDKRPNQAPEKNEIHR